MRNIRCTGKKRVLLILIAALFALLVLVYVAALIVDHFFLSADTELRFPTDHFIFEPADWEANIFEDEEYLSLDRTVRYSNGAESFPLAGTEFEVAPGATLFLAYIDALTHGDANALNDLYTEEYLQEEGRHDPFTMQRVYDITVTYMAVYFQGDGMIPDTDQVRFSLDYKISENDGTFRKDIDSDSSRTQIFTLLKTDNGYRIDDVQFYLRAE